MPLTKGTVNLHTLDNQGSAALDLCPGFQNDILRVQREPAFEIADLRWISAVLGFGIRLTIAEETWKQVSQMESMKWMKQDMLFGSPIRVHLMFSFQQSVEDKKHHFGHYDLLVPGGGLFSVLLRPDAAWMRTGTAGEVSIYINV